MKTLLTIALPLSLLLLTASCKKAEEPSTAGKTPIAPAKEATPTKNPIKTPPKVAPAFTDSVTVLASHTDPAKQEGDPVKVVFSNVVVKSASFNPANLEGGTAELEISIAGLKSGNEKRDGHLASADLLDLAAFPTAKVTINNIKKIAGNNYKATAKISYRGKEVTWTPSFAVTGTYGKTIHLKSGYKFNLADFGVGNADGAIADNVVVNVLLELKAS